MFSAQLDALFAHTCVLFSVLFAHLHSYMLFTYLESTTLYLYLGLRMLCFWIFPIYISLIILISILIGTWEHLKNRKSIDYNGQRVLVIGGTSGLGLALAQELRAHGASVTITSRKREALDKHRDKFHVRVLDITSDHSVSTANFDYDIVFCCAGICHPSTARGLSLKDTKACTETNYHGPVRVFIRMLPMCTAEKRRRLVLIGSTVSFRSFLGYAQYAPSKAALKSFHESVRVEAEAQGLDMSVFYVSTIRSPGYAAENLKKPQATKQIEGSTDTTASEPRERAKYLLKNLSTHPIVISDIQTRLFSFAPDLLRPSDVLIWILSPIFWYIFKQREAHIHKSTI